MPWRAVRDEFRNWILTAEPAASGVTDQESPTAPQPSLARAGIGLLSRGPQVRVLPGAPFDSPAASAQMQARSGRANFGAFACNYSCRSPSSPTCSASPPKRIGRGTQDADPCLMCWTKRGIRQIHDPHRLWSLQDLSTKLGAMSEPCETRRAAIADLDYATYGNAVVFRIPYLPDHARRRSGVHAAGHPKVLLIYGETRGPSPDRCSIRLAP